MRTLLKSLTVALAILSLPSCTAYMYEGYGHHRHHRDCDRERQSGYGFIGIAIARAGESGRGPIVVAHVLPGGPADQANILPGDRIRAIDGESTRGMTIPEAARLIRGPVEAPVELRLDSPHGARLVTLVRVPARGMGYGRGYGYGGGRPCDECRHGKHCGEDDAPCGGGMPRAPGAPGDDVPAMAPPPPPDMAPAPPPDVDESLAPELWPPTKPGHRAP
jgi:hypothetical protein